MVRKPTPPCVLVTLRWRFALPCDSRSSATNIASYTFAWTSTGWSPHVGLPKIDRTAIRPTPFYLSFERMPSTKMNLSLFDCRWVLSGLLWQSSFKKFTAVDHMCFRCLFGESVIPELNIRTLSGMVPWLSWQRTGGTNAWAASTREFQFLRRQGLFSYVCEFHDLKFQLHFVLNRTKSEWWGSDLTEQNTGPFRRCP